MSETSKAAGGAEILLGSERQQRREREDERFDERSCAEDGKYLITI